MAGMLDFSFFAMIGLGGTQMSLRQVEPSLTGSPLEVCLALLSGDHAPAEAAYYLSRIINSLKDDMARMLKGAQMRFEAAARLNELEELKDSLGLIDSAKELLRKAVLSWLEPRICPCCVEMREKLERGA
jgi:hypothetical protein